MDVLVHPPMVSDTIPDSLRFGFLDYQWLQGFTFAIKEINDDPSLMPNITLGFWIYDSCRALQRVLQGTLWMLTGQEETIANYRCQEDPPMVGVVGDSGSTNSILMARVLGLYRIPLISYFSTNPLLSDRNQFPSFFRTIPSDDVQSHGLARLVMYFGWTWVGLLAEDTDYGQQGIQIVKQELLRAGACVAFSENIILSKSDRNAFHITQVIKGSSANAIVVFCLDVDFAPILDEMVRQNVTGKVLIASEAWSTSTLLSVKKYSGILAGTLGFAIHSGEMPGFEEYLSSVNPSKYPEDIFTREFWKEAFGCAWPDQQTHLKLTIKPCTGTEKINSLPNYYDATNLRITFNTYMAVYAFANALQNLISCEQGKGPFIDGTCADLVDFKPWQVLHYVKNVHFQSKAGTELNFDNSGNPQAQYDIVNWQENSVGIITHVKVGSYDSSVHSGESLNINAIAIRWAAGNTQGDATERSTVRSFRGSIVPSCYRTSQSGEGRARASSQESLPGLNGIVFSLIPSGILGLFLRYRNTPVVRANNRTLSYLLLLSLSFCFLTSLTFVGYPIHEKCLLRQVTFGIIFSLCVSCILAKTMMVLIAFSATKPNSALKKYAGPKLSYVVISICTLIQILLCVFWLALAPPFTEHNNYSQPGTIIVECNEGSPAAFWCMLAYLGLLASVSLLVAFLARKLPDSFNEAKFITFSMLAFLSVWISFIPAYLSTRGKYMVAMEIFAIQSSTSALLVCIFFPKCYIILIRPDMNTKQRLMGRTVEKMVHHS
ncbi:extracellular calcium-sensing receptor-like [Pleurodeles waltl]|uniref:extracellular calcium-sensing receptor-like n=1 Tax=Pleurodeles waltl TaxID=8319 RepID=UPI003709AFE3